MENGVFIIMLRNSERQKQMEIIALTQVKSQNYTGLVH